MNRTPPTSELDRQSDLRLFVINFFVYILCILCTTVFMIGAFDFIRSVEDNKCEMTYMYEFPQFVKIQMPIENDKQFGMYGLYAYTEGKQIDNVRRFKFTGIPVLFLPGNAGSYKQVRSFASIALRKWLDSRTPFHFDFFTIDFHEEMSGIYGYVLEKQSQYARKAVEKIMTFYEDFQHVVLIGHSMGGLVAKAVNVDEVKSQLIFTLATPHQRAILLTDPEFDLFYYHVEKNWTNLVESEGKQVSLVSVAGGDRDRIIPNKLTAWKHNDIHTSAPSIPGVWASTDHLSIVWCKQLVLTVVRSLFDLVQYRKKSNYFTITENVTLRTSILEYHFLKRSSGKSYHSAHPMQFDFGQPPTVLWMEYFKHDHCQAHTYQLTYIMFPIITFSEKVKGNSEDYRILLMTSNTKAKNWIFGCSGQTIVNHVRFCSEMVDLSNQTQLLPSLHRRRKLVHLDYSNIKNLKFSHLVVKFDPVNYPSCVNVEIYNQRHRTQELGTKIQVHNAMFFNLTYPMNFELSRAFAWKLTAQLEKNRNNDSTCKGDLNGIGLFHNGNFQTHNFLKNESLLIRFTDWTSSAFSLVYLVRGCHYTLSLQIAWIETAGQLFRTYWRLLPSHFASIILMTLYFQKPKNWINFHQVLITKAYYLTLVPGFITAFMIVFLPNDFKNTTMMSSSEFTIFLPIVCYLISYALALVIAIGAYYAMLGVGGAAHTLTMRFLTKKLGNVPDKVTDFALTVTLEKFPISVAVLIISLAMTTCGTMGLAIGLFLYLLKIFKLYEGFLEDLVRGKVMSIEETLSPINFHMHGVMLWFIVTVSNLPSLIYWINNFSFSQVPQWDLSLYICLMLTPALAILWQGFVPDFNPILWNMQRYLCYIMGLVMILWGTHRFYLVCFMVVLVLITLAMCQLISRFAESESTPSAPELDEQTPTQSKKKSTKHTSTDSSSTDEIGGMEDVACSQSDGEDVSQDRQDSVEKSSESQTNET